MGYCQVTYLSILHLTELEKDLKKPIESTIPKLLESEFNFNIKSLFDRNHHRAQNNLLLSKVRSKGPLFGTLQTYVVFLQSRKASLRRQGTPSFMSQSVVPYCVLKTYCCTFQSYPPSMGCSHLEDISSLRSWVFFSFLMLLPPMNLYINFRCQWAKQHCNRVGRSDILPILFH